MSCAAPGWSAAVSVQVPDAVLELRPKLLESRDAFKISLHPGNLVIKLLMLADKAAQMIVHLGSFPARISICTVDIAWRC